MPPEVIGWAVAIVLTVALPCYKLVGSLGVFTYDKLGIADANTRRDLIFCVDFFLG